jgi:hypothetical protein
MTIHKYFLVAIERPMHCSAAIALCVLLWNAAIGCAAEPQQGAIQPHKSADGWPFKGEALVSVQPGTVTMGEMVHVDCEVHLTGGSDDLFNPFLSGEYRLPAQLVITSADGKVRRELLSRSPGAPQAQRPTAWLRVQAGQGVGRRFAVRVASRDKVEPDVPHELVVDLPPGQYWVQAVYSHWLVATWPNHPRALSPRVTDGSGDEPRPIAPWSAKEMDRPLLISRPVSLLVRGDRDASPNTRQQDATPQCPLHLELRPASTKVAVGFEADVEIRFTNQSSQTIEVYDPLLFRRWGPWRATSVAILDHRGTTIGDLLHALIGKATVPVNSDWVDMPPGGIVSTRFQFRAGIVEGTRHFHTGNLLPPGRYLLELKVHQHMLAGRPSDLVEDNARRQELAGVHSEQADRAPQMTLAEWRKSRPGPEVGRSARVELEFAPPVQ